MNSGSTHTIGALALLSGISLGLLPACTENQNEDPAGQSAQGSGGSSSAAPGEGTVSVDDWDVKPGEMIGGSSGTGPVCKSSSSEAALVPVHLGFVLDVSGSMGKLADSACFDPVFKWQPVFDATTAFFGAADSEGLSASMTLFPSRNDRCDVKSYSTPDVSLRALPADDFRESLLAYEAEVADEGWRGNTPTHEAFLGALTSLQATRVQAPDARLALVLVTDGKPQGCEDDIDTISTSLAQAAEQGINTYVIGVKQPVEKDGCDAEDENGALQENLDTLALAGGTGVPFMINTGNPTATQDAFSAAIFSIRQTAVSCESVIPPHPNGGSFDPDKIDVSIRTDGEVIALPYDPSCTLATGWHYDDADAATKIELCAEACVGLQSRGTAALDVNYLCEPRIDIAR